jgi:hypothetical protein
MTRTQVFGMFVAALGLVIVTCFCVELAYLGVVPYVYSVQIKLWHALEKPRRNGLDPPAKACANRVAATERWSLLGVPCAN